MDSILRKVFHSVVIVSLIVVIIYYSTFNATKRDKQVDKNITIEDLSEIVQKELARIQTPSLNPRNCSVQTIHCAHGNRCGFACQIEHRIACLMVSYAYNMPLIHDNINGWPYSKLWNQIFYRMDSPCLPGPLTRYLTATVVPNQPVKPGSIQDFKYYLPDGIPVPKYLADKVDLLHPEPFFWWLGQFMKFGLRLQPNETKSIREAQRALQFAHPIVGIHIRRSDKLGESPEGFHEVKEYFDAAQKYYDNLTLQGLSFGGVKRVFLATEDQRVTTEVNEKYHPPEWNIIYFNLRRNISSQWDRKDFVDDIVLDLMTLADCDYIVCGHTSNVGLYGASRNYEFSLPSWATETHVTRPVYPPFAISHSSTKNN